jgi:hypothetical protein
MLQALIAALAHPTRAFRSTVACSARMRSPTHPLYELVLQPTEDQVLDSVDEGPGCGWFESSFELRRGLVITEYAQFEPHAVSQPAASPLQ